MEPTDELITQLRREDLEQARRMTPEQKFRAGGDLFDAACRWTLAGIRNQNRELTDGEAFQELRRRLTLARAREDRC